MAKYIDRLVKCGYTRAQSYGICCDFINNLTITDLDNFITSMERVRNVCTL